jgi:hypothetical protein
MVRLVLPCHQPLNFRQIWLGLWLTGESAGTTTPPPKLEYRLHRHLSYIIVLHPTFLHPRFTDCSRIIILKLYMTFVNGLGKRQRLFELPQPERSAHLQIRSTLYESRKDR